ncbi:hypothetical protein [Citrobacter freundii]|nr:hypothetical protein [Citrobacter freundii]MDT7323709.1 hypothetical protein [Citrobacter freundii]WNT12912.1 hypothetical protein RRL10_03875 [Citrobacter freundii]
MASFPKTSTYWGITMANIIYATVTGEKQGMISAGCGTSASIGNK